jgi:ATP-dependent DNA helicase RecG
VELTPQIEALPVELTPQIEALPVELTPQIEALPVELTPQIEALPVELRSLELPQDIKKELEKLGPRASKAKIKALIIKICAIRPFKLPEIAFLLNRNPNYVREMYLISLVKTGALIYTFPHQPNHPRQGYRTK